MKRLSCFFLIISFLLPLSSAVFADNPLRVTASTAAAEPLESTGASETVPEETVPAETATAETDPEETGPAVPDSRPDEYHQSYVHGMPDGCFYPNSEASRAQLAVILYALGRYEAGPSRFSDVPEGAWYSDAVNALASAGVLSGFPDGTFRPDAKATRAELVTVLAAVSGETAASDESFPDVPADHWAGAAIALAKEKGWVSGFPDGGFYPEKGVTRAEAVTILNHFFGRVPDAEAIASGSGLPFFPDVQSDSWYYDAVMEAATGHSAIYATADADEQWWNPSAGGSVWIPDGFYCIGGRLFAAENGAYIHSQTTGTLNGISYSCTGSSGVCTARTEVLALADGELILLSGGVPIAAPGSYDDGIYLKAGHLYAAKDGFLLHTPCTVSFYGVDFNCTGYTGRCTTASWKTLNLSGIDLSVFSQTMTPEATLSADWNVTTADVLRACVRIYEAYFRVEYPVSSGQMQDYINKALEYGILDGVRASYDQAITRGETAIYLWRAVRGRTLDAINDIPRVPDIDDSYECYYAVLSLYRAGIMTGSGEEHEARVSEPVSLTELAETITRLERVNKRVSFTLPEKVIRTIQYGTSGSGSFPLTAYQIGDGKNVMVLTFALHGWEDNWDQDGEMLVYLADKLDFYLENNYDLVRDGDWTVYILRCMNPDGLYYGTTCNGPGRCTTTYYNSAGELKTDRGIDMNRSFPYCFASFSGSRNFNGSAPLACAEARAIADFVTNAKGSGFNILIDTHGWYSQIITSSGYGTIYDAFRAQFTGNSYASLYGARGYLSSWAAYELGYDSCLLELPGGIYSTASFYSSGCVVKFQAAIADLLQHYNGPKATKESASRPEIELTGN